MPGGLMQLVAKGAQDQLVNGNASFTHFRSMYKRHTDFAMEHFRLTYKTTNLSIPASGNLTLQARVDRNAQLLHDCYISVTLPNIFSPVVPVASVPSYSPVNPNSTAIGYEFQWVKNIGYNMINYVSIRINSQEIVRHTGEWMKLYAALTFNANKKAVLNELVGNVPQLYDPANAYDRIQQYPHSISTSTSPAEPSIYGSVLTIPMHFWFCEDIGSALPLIALQHSEVDFVIEFKNVYEMFTILDVNPASPTFGTRIPPNPANPQHSISHFLSPPSYPDPTIPVNPSLTLWDTQGFIECNYIFLNDPELIHVAKTDHSFIIKQMDIVSTFGQYGPSNDLELTLRNLCTRVVWVAQRNDRGLANDYDNYTNWVDPEKPPLDSTALLYMTPWYSSGNTLSTSTSQREILLDSSIILDGAERFNYKQTEFFSHIQNYRHNYGKTITDLPGIYTYSFALDSHNLQPSGHLNGSMFNRTILRNTYVQPPLIPGTAGSTRTCILKSTAFNPKPTVVNPQARGTDGKLLYHPDDLVNIVTKTSGQALAYTFDVRAFVESYNFLRVLGGVANVVFSS